MHRFLVISQKILPKGTQLLPFWVFQVDSFISVNKHLIQKITRHDFLAVYSAPLPLILLSSNMRTYHRCRISQGYSNFYLRVSQNLQFHRTQGIILYHKIMINFINLKYESKAISIFEFLGTQFYRE